MVFTPELVMSGHWIKRNDYGVVRELKCHPDGTLTEWDPALPEHTWSGTWQIEGTCLHFQVMGYWMSVTDQSSEGWFSAVELPPEAQQLVPKPRGGMAMLGAPAIPFRVQHVGTLSLPFEIVEPRFPGRPNLPIIGPRHFVKAVTAILDELEEKAPYRYQQVVENLPQAKYDPEEVKRTHSDKHEAHAGGVFANDGSHPDAFMYLLLHETGHNVAGHYKSPGSELSVRVKEEQAHAYAELVFAELGRPTLFPQGFPHERYTT